MPSLTNRACSLGARKMPLSARWLRVSACNLFLHWRKFEDWAMCKQICSLQRRNSKGKACNHTDWRMAPAFLASWRHRYVRHQF
jgi:hypothetical protein